MKKVLNVLLALMLVSGCELVYIPIAMVAIPLVAIGQSITIKQDFTIVDKSGRRLAGPAPETAADGKTVQLSGAETVFAPVPIITPGRCSVALFPNRPLPVVTGAECWARFRRTHRILYPAYARQDPGERPNRVLVKATPTSLEGLR